MQTLHLKGGACCRCKLRVMLLKTMCCAAPLCCSSQQQPGSWQLLHGTAVCALHPPPRCTCDVRGSHAQHVVHV